MPKPVKQKARRSKHLGIRLREDERLRLELASVERAETTSDTARAFIRDGLKRHEKKRAA